MANIILLNTENYNFGQKKTLDKSQSSNFEFLKPSRYYQSLKSHGVIMYFRLYKYNIQEKVETCNKSLGTSNIWSNSNSELRIKLNISTYLKGLL